MEPMLAVILRRARPFATLAAAFGLVLACGPAAAGTPVAIVEEVGGDANGVEAMDYLTVGQVIRLAPGAHIVVSYFNSCARETITGADVKIGDERSFVAGGTAERVTVECDAGKMVLTPSQSGQLAGFIDRDPSDKRARIRRMPKTQLTLYGASPLVVEDGDDPVVIQRLGGDHDIEQLPAARDHGRMVYDYARSGRSLTAGAVYLASAGARHVVFRVDSNARPGPAPIAGRLILFEK